MTHQFSSSARLAPQAKAPRSATVPKPFNLSTGSKRKAAAAVEESAYVPMAQRIQQFEKRTPDRYHLRSRRSQERGGSPPGPPGALRASGSVT